MTVEGSGLKSHSKEPGFGKATKAKLVLSLILPPLLVFLWFRFLVGDGIPLDRIITACGLVVQVDTFLMAGFMVGILWYWNAFLRFLGPRLPYRVMATIAVPLVTFTVSSFFSITGALTGDIIYLEWALFLTIYGVVVIIDGWNVLHQGLNSLVPSKPKS